MTHENERFSGTIVGERGRLVFADATLTVGKKKHVERHEGAGVLELLLGDGRTLEVRGVARAAKRGKVELDGAYRELAEHPIAALFEAKAPGDHVKAQIRGFALVVGDVITVEGEVIEERVAARREDGQNLREAPRREAAVIEAKTIALGTASIADDDPGPRARRSEPARPRDRVRRPLETSAYLSLAVGAPLVVGGLLLSFFAPLVPLRAWLTPIVGLGLALALVGGGRLVRGRGHASYVTIVGGRRLTPWEPIRGYGADFLLLVLGYASWCWLSALEPSPSAVTVCLAIVAVLPAIHVAALFLQERAFRRFAALALALPTRGDPGGSRMLLAEGRVETEGTVVRRRVEFVPKTETSWSTDKNGHQHERTSTTIRDREHTSADAFTLVLEGERRVEVRPSEAHVALSRRRWVPHASLAVYEETLVHRDRACVVARFETTEDGTLRAAARGDESLFLFGGSRAELVRALWLARARLALGVLATLAPIALGLYAFPFGARFHATATVTSSSGVVPVGTECALRVLAHHYGETPRCSVRLSCDEGDAAYGGFGMGQMDCTFTEDALDPSARGEDASAYDGDAAIAFSLPERTLRWNDESGASFLATLAPSSPSLWW